MRLLVALLSLSLMIVPALSNDGMAARQSKFSVKETVDRLVLALKERGIVPAARIDHAAGAKSVGIDMRPTELLLFGNPRLGTPLIIANQRAALDLPMRILVWEDQQNRVWLGYLEPEALKKRYGLGGQDERLSTMKGVLESLAGAAGN